MAALAVQKAVVAALIGRDGLTGVYDGPPADAEAPYAVIGPEAVSDIGHKSGAVHEVRMLVTIWDDRPGAARLRAILAAAAARLTAMGGVWDGQRIVLARQVRSGVGPAEAGWRPGSLTLRVICETV